MAIVDQLKRLGGVARTRALLASGVSQREIARAVASNGVRRVRRGVFALPDADARVIAAVWLGGRLTCVSALELHEVSLLVRNKQAHVEVPHLVAVDSALHQGLVRPSDIAVFSASDHARRDWLLAHADGRAESVGETLARLSCVRRWLAVHPQRYIPGVGRVDLVVENQVVVEVDGFGFHGDPESFRCDARRGRKVVHQGMPVLRFAHAELVGAGAVDVGAEVARWLAGAPAALTLGNASEPSVRA